MTQKIILCTKTYSKLDLFVRTQRNGQTEWAYRCSTIQSKTKKDFVARFCATYGWPVSDVRAFRANK
jgi:hypothetical protein